MTGNDSWKQIGLPRVSGHFSLVEHCVLFLSHSLFSPTVFYSSPFSLAEETIFIQFGFVPSASGKRRRRSPIKRAGIPLLFHELKDYDKSRWEFPGDMWQEKNCDDDLLGHSLITLTLQSSLWIIMRAGVETRVLELFRSNLRWDTSYFGWDFSCSSTAPPDKGRGRTSIQSLTNWLLTAS